MTCGRCGQECQTAVSTEAVELENGGLLVVRHIPCYKCGACGEIHYNGEVVEHLERLTAFAQRIAQEITVIDYTKAA